MVMRRLMRYLIPHRKTLLIAFGMLALATAADVAGPQLVRIFIDDYLTPRQFDREMLILLGAGYLILHIAGVTINYFQLLSFHKIAHWIVRQLRMDVFSKVQHLGLEFFDRTPGGSLVSRITNDTEAVKELFVSVLSAFVQSIVLMVGILIGLFILDPRLAALFLVVAPLVVGLMWFYRKISSKVFHLSREKLSQLNARLNESIQGMTIIQAFHQEKRMREEFGQTNEEHYQANMKRLKINGLLLRPMVDLLYMFALIMILGYFGYNSLTTAISIGVIYAFLNYLDRFFEPVNQMMFRLAQLQEALVAAERVFQLLDQDRYAPQQEGGDNPTVQDGLIEFKNVTFSYDGVNPVLKNISFTAKPGQTVALVGHTGSGKSTIINLLMRFYNITEGEVTIDGAPLRSFSDAELRKKLGLVLQDPFLFVGDVKQNIRLHNMEISDEEILEAAKFVQADPFIQKLPHGYDEPVGERGATFSSGQRQLLSFARTVALNPKILVLDEATASVDTETEEMIQSALEKMRRGRTTIAIAHRLSTIQDADLILVLHQGVVVERGTHQELLAEQGLYHKMYLLQQGAVETAAV
ncbi:ATP-binding cassette subfamily B protein [Tumebacillus sp. BK434]|uniref:ABC transporter ATP-binding protein n=1 Tax=Tumebacillus sp. BK434 TaxID=2512169 RepID=UPI00104D92AA|nr:ABC transporter ATP-binding protein [Tumebacillus sp. BK434]TCP57612.1 ATP-binding cassette subfamily B protein [Tumebacillus sp. BK434]